MNYKKPLLTSVGIALLLIVSGPQVASAASTPSLGTAGTYGILSSTFTRNVGVTGIFGDLGYTTLGGSGSHTVSGSTFVVPPAQAGTDQSTALGLLNAQACDYNFGSPTDLSLLAQPLAPGVYCVAAATSIGTGGITLSGTGTYIFRITGALTSVANSNVTLANGASSCDVFWTPSAATTLGANTTFKGTVIDDSGITVGNTTSWIGRALAFGGTVTTDTDTITTSCAIGASTSVSQRPATINVVKLVINDNGGTMKIADFPLFVNGTPVASGVTNTFPAPALRYQVSETTNANYAQSFSGDCGTNGGINLVPGDNKFCIITNNDIGAAVVVAPIPPLIDVVKVPSPLSLPNGPGLVNYTYTLRNIGTVPVTDITLVGDTCSPIVRASGDTNNNSILEVTETWVHTCSTTLTKTHTNTVVTTGWANGLSAVDITSATVVVGLPVIPPLIHITKIPSPSILGVGGDMVTYTKIVNNPGIAPLANVHITDDQCTPVRYVYGDLNGNSLLENTETWVFSCRTNISQTTTNTAFVTGEANGLVARDFSIATVVVALGVPGLPNTGISPSEQSVTLNAGALVALLLVVMAPTMLMLRKRSVTLK